MTGKTSAEDLGIDRRVRRTRAALQHAFLSLLHRKDYASITIEEICEAANVGRSTFYAHYQGKEDLKRSGIDQHLHQLLTAKRAIAGAGAAAEASPTLVIFEHTWEQRKLYRALVGGRGADVAIDAIKRTLSGMLRKDLGSVSRTGSDMAREVTIHFLVGAFISLLVWWLDRGAPHSPQEMERLFRQMTDHGALSLLDVESPQA